MSFERTLKKMTFLYISLMYLPYEGAHPIITSANKKTKISVLLECFYY